MKKEVKVTAVKPYLKTLIKLSASETSGFDGETLRSSKNIGTPAARNAFLSELLFADGSGTITVTSRNRHLPSITSLLMLAATLSASRAGFFAANAHTFDV